MIRYQWSFLNPIEPVISSLPTPNPRQSSDGNLHQREQLVDAGKLAHFATKWPTASRHEVMYKGLLFERNKAEQYGLIKLQ